MKNTWAVFVGGFFQKGFETKEDAIRYANQRAKEIRELKCEWKSTIRVVKWDVKDKIIVPAYEGKDKPEVQLKGLNELLRTN